MPNRILRDWTDSFTIALLDVNQERFFTRLIMKVDDYGCFHADTRILKSSLFPLIPDIRESDISRWLTACEKAGLIVLYNVANRELLQIKNFKQALRQKKAKYPLPSDCIEDDTQMSSNCIADDTLKRNESETENETENEGCDFDVFWDLYDKKVGDKSKLKKKWEKISADEKRKIFEYIPKYIQSRPDKQYRKDPATFLNNKSWNDEIISSMPVISRPKSGFTPEQLKEDWNQW